MTPESQVPLPPPEWLGQQPGYTAEQVRAIVAERVKAALGEPVAWLLPEYGRAFVKRENVQEFLAGRVPSFHLSFALNNAVPLYAAIATAQSADNGEG